MSASKPWNENWEIEADMPGGGQGSTCRVRSKIDPTTVGVLKRLHSQKETLARSRMHREVVHLQTLAPAGIKVPKVLDSNTSQFDDLSVPLFFVMDLIPGRTLSETVTDHGPFDPDKAAALTLDMAQTIAAAHSESVIHRDLKPENVIVRDLDKNDLVIVDYGLSFNRAEEGTSVTEAGAQFRNRFLSLPETNSPGDNKRDPRIDLTAVCAMFWYLLTGHVPGHLTDGRGRLPHRREGIGVGPALVKDGRRGQIEAFFDRGLAIDRENRFQTWLELTERLQAAIKYASNMEVADPITVAEELTRSLRQSDRTSWISMYRPQASQFFQVIQKYVSSLGNKLGPHFVISFSGTPLRGWGELPAEYQEVETNGRNIGLTIKPHNHTFEIIYAIGAKGNQFVLLRKHRSTKNSGGRGTPDVTSWEEVMWFNPESWPDEAGLQALTKRDVSSGLKALSDIVLNPS